MEVLPSIINHLGPEGLAELKNAALAAQGAGAADAIDDTDDAPGEPMGSFYSRLTDFSELVQNFDEAAKTE